MSSADEDVMRVERHHAWPVGRAVLLASMLFSVCSGAVVFLLFVASGQETREAFPLVSEPTATEILLRRLQQAAHTNPEQEIMLHMSVGHLFVEQGLYKDALHHYAAARDLSAKSDGRELLVESSVHFGTTLLLQGRLREARHVMEQAVSSLGDVAKGALAFGAQRALGTVLSEMGDLPEALESYEKARKTKPDSELLAKLLIDIGDVYLRQGDVEKGARYIQRSIKTYQQLRIQGLLKDVDISKSYALLAVAESKRANGAKAIELCRKSLRLQKGRRASHPGIVGAKLTMSRAQRDLGESKVALAVLLDVESSLRDGPQEGLEMSRTLLAKADLLREMERLAEAETVVEEAIELQVRSFGSEDNPEKAIALNIYGSILHDQGAHEEALKQYSFALDMSRRTAGHWNQETAAAHNSLGTVYQDMGNHAEALAHFQKCLAIQLKTVGESSIDVASTYNNIATILYRQSDANGAAEILRKALKVLDTAGAPQDYPDRIVYEDNLDAVLLGARPRERNFLHVL